MANIHHLKTVDSTNTEARRQLDANAPTPFWIIADEQTEGRGRLGREWISKPGNLYSTFAFPIDTATAHGSQISFVAALAVHDVATTFINNAMITLKWPNDCLINGAKFSGVLAELYGNTMILGMGLNVLHEPEVLPYKATCLTAHAPTVTVAQTFELLQLKLKKWLQMWENGDGFQHIHRAWEARCDLIGMPISLDTGRTILHGTFAGLAPDGGLLMNHNNTTSLHHAGDVRIIATETNPI